MFETLIKSHFFDSSSVPTFTWEHKKGTNRTLMPELERVVPKGHQVPREADSKECRKAVLTQLCVRSLMPPF